MSSPNQSKTTPLIPGIDLGTTTICAYVNKSPVMLTHGSSVYPTMLQIDNKRGWSFTTGTPPPTKWAPHVKLAKRLIGRSPADGRLKQDVRRVPHAELGDRGAVFRVGGKVYHPEEISAFILHQVRTQIELEKNKSVLSCVLAVPAYFHCEQRKSSIDAARMAGFTDDVRLVDEPVAAAVDFVMNRHEELLNGSFLLVIDIGGGTTDVTLIYSDRRGETPSFVVKATAGDNFLGGVDIDEALIEFVKGKAGDVGYLVDEEKLRQECEVKKAKFSQLHQQEVCITLHGGSPDNEPTDAMISRDEFNNVCKPIRDRVSSVIDETFLDAETLKQNVNYIILTGGSCYLPFVRDLCTEKLPGVAISLSDPAGSVARGASFIASHSIDIVTVLPRSLGVEAHKQTKDDDLFMQHIAKRNIPLPNIVSHIFYTTEDNQHEVEISIAEGEEEDINRNILLRSITISNIPDCKKGTEVKVTLNISEPGLVEATAKIGSKQSDLTITYGNRFSEAELSDFTNQTSRRSRPASHAGNSKAGVTSNETEDGTSQAKVAGDQAHNEAAIPTSDEMPLDAEVSEDPSDADTLAPAAKRQKTPAGRRRKPRKA
ncbi:Hsp70 protein-domain-containing protein [Thelonectria olida]|uniref:Hsp70 protein-domain-containing protein n=1 Tax=Thelonectria olida TaxID=1576542 RepID=A0A9P8VWF1_9HYPO|nr:Hsp70 protein-domain-containing protein [Thelonectria olida]